MARSLVFGNGRLHVGLDEHGLVHDLYYPYIGLENHIPPHSLAHKVGVFVQGRMSWLDDAGWTVRARYHQHAMVGETIATNEQLGLRVELTDAVAHNADVFVRTIHIINTKLESQTVTLFCHQIFMISEAETSDSAQYRPDVPGVVHYKGERVFLATLRQGEQAFTDYSIGRYSADGISGTFRDAEDGVLEKNTVENGRTDSVLGIKLELEPYGSGLCEYMLCAAEAVRGVEILAETVLSRGALHHLTNTAAYWTAWLETASIPKGYLSDEQLATFEHSLFVMKAHIDERGAVMASLDSSLRDHPQDDSYNFCWPRDASYILWPLMRLGYMTEARKFFHFTAAVLSDAGYLSHKYRADGSLGSTWLPYVQPDGTVAEPIQADETAVVLFLLGQYFRLTNEQSLLVDFYEKLVEPMANFLAGYMDDGLPKASYDLWEHTYAVNTYTVAVTYGALLEAGDMAEAYGREADKNRWHGAAEQILNNAHRLYNESANFFYKGLDVRGQPDLTLDMSSLYGAFMYGLFPPDSPEMKTALTTAKQSLSRDNLYMRFKADEYYSEDEVSNVWPLVSLWVAQIALERGDIATAEKIIDTVLDVTSESGMIPEQITADGRAVSVSPLVWSHAELVSTLIDYMQARSD